jgi:hypothetical protein
MARTKHPRFRFEATPAELRGSLDDFVAATVDTLSSFYMAFPRRSDFLEYGPFRQAYLEFAAATDGYRPSHCTRTSRTTTGRCTAGMPSTGFVGSFAGTTG